MEEVYLSKSRYCKLAQCEKMIWLNKYKPDEAAPKEKESILAKGKEVGELAKRLFGDYEDIPYDDRRGVMIEKTKELLKNKPNVITEASFSYENNFCSVDILKNDADGVEIYEVKATTNCYEDKKCTRFKEKYLDDAAYQYFVLSSCGLNVKKVAIVYLNKEYRKYGDLDINELFAEEDITSMVRQKQDEIRDNIDHINMFMAQYGEDNEPDTDIGVHCFKPYECDFWQYCTRHLPRPNVFDISGMRKTTQFKNYYNGKVSFEDLEGEKLNEKYSEQIDFELYDREPKIERKEIKRILDDLKYPLYFIDYETCQYAIPEYEGTKPFQQIPFQYSLHIIREEGVPVEHREFLGDIDDEDLIRHFAESMVNDVSEDGSVIIYNRSFEPSRNREIAEIYPEFKEDMERINDNMVDFMVPFSKRYYYTKEMEGSYSIKYVLPALFPDNSKLDYSKLPTVHNGGEASQAFLDLEGKSKEEQEPIRQGLLEYCKLDTLAMVKIWEKFREVTE